jgi:hypothetical protein
MAQAATLIARARLPCIRANHFSLATTTAAPPSVIGAHMAMVSG